MKTNLHFKIVYVPERLEKVNEIMRRMGMFHEKDGACMEQHLVFSCNKKGAINEKDISACCAAIEKFFVEEGCEVLSVEYI